ncbi:PP2C family protein-serine/threonine phosphatase [Demequina sp.]|uniref:PP2C family protein-serine/threonine phosphatase n=1 Tax=Demequina sp. TaxID=2050685 RepID=UPI003D0FAAD7
MTPRAWSYGYGATDAGPRARNEDSFCAAPPVYVVADGMGGHAAGADASSAVARTFAQLAHLPVITPDDVTAAVQQAQLAVVEVSRAVGGHSGSTLTGVIGVEHAGEPWWMVINVGDSRVYRLVDGVVDQLTVDHSHVQELIDAGEITAAEAEVHPDRNVVTRAIGDGDFSFDAWLLPVRPGERLIVASDGLTKVLSDARIAEIINLAGDDAAMRLVGAALAANTTDNVTAIVAESEGAVTREGANPYPWREWTKEARDDDTTQTTRVKVWA